MVFIKFWVLPRQTELLYTQCLLLYRKAWKFTTLETLQTDLWRLIHRVSVLLGQLVIFQRAPPLRENRRRGLSAVLQYFLFYSKGKKEIVLSTKLSLRIQKIEKWVGGGIKFWWEKIHAREHATYSIPGVFLSNSQGFFLKDDHTKGNRSSSYRELSTASFLLFILLQPPKITENQSLRGIDESKMNDILFWFRLA